MDMIDLVSVCISVVVGGIIGVVVMMLSEIGEMTKLKEENERLNNKLRRDVPRDAHGRFTRKK
jgi:hypothetical protein